ncbi:Hok/Gef family protein [Salmonella enterica subsp. enterica]|nr:Hok/Gef family protein [Salmonella enterica subsp. enterica]
MRLYAKELCACLVVVCFTILIYVWMVRGSRFAVRGSRFAVRSAGCTSKSGTELSAYLACEVEHC